MSRDFDSPRAKNIALALLGMTQFVVVIDASIVNVALPEMGSALGISQDNLSWIVNSYTLTFGGFLLLGGRLADFLGRRRMFIVGMIIFSLASLLGGFAQSEGWLIAARAVQGFGAALISPAALSIITTTFKEGAERNRALGVWGAVAGAGGAAGVLLGGVLTEYLSWRWVLFVNVPIGLFLAFEAPRHLRESTAEEEEERTFDIPGAVSITLGLALLVFALVDAERAGWTSTETILRLAGAALLILAFVVIELRTRKPLVPFSIFSLRTLRGANTVGLLVGMSLFSMFFLITLYLQQVLGQSAIEAGLSVSAALRSDHPLGRCGLAARQQDRIQERADHRPPLRRRRARLVHAGECAGRLLRLRRARAIDAGGDRARSLVRLGDDRGGHRDHTPGGRPGVGPHQHLPAGRRRARVGDPRLDRELDDERRLRLRRDGQDRRADAGVPGRVHRRRLLRGGGGDPRRDPHLLEGLGGARRGSEEGEAPASAA